MKAVCSWHSLQQVKVYSRTRLIRMANVRKNRANYPSMLQIIRAYFTLRFYQWQRIVSRASMRIKWGSELARVKLSGL